MLGNFAVLLGYFIFQILRDFWNIVREEIDDFYNLSQFLNLEYHENKLINFIFQF